MKRSAILAAVILGLTVIRAPSRVVHADGGLPCTPVANGQGAATCSAEFDNQVQVFPVGPPCVPAGYVIWTASGRIHLTINKAGDGWDTGTFEGPFVEVQSINDLSTVIASGHGTMWFGDSFNNQNVVNHGTINFEGHTADGSAMGFHEDMHFSISASGMGPLFFDKTHCS